ncbi:DrmB family protein [Methanothermobacter sp. DP]|uniref:DrmB family protein n=1 Tax=Methanothermobacter sp. DP TaxID=2998972 RepID=UPI002AA5A8F1|nr:DrmB family protein [Methanothermobacter sp. DP]
MSHDVQHLRRSQFIFTYGPGAILEGKNGPRIIPSLNQGLRNLFTSEYLEKFEVTDSRLSEFLKKNEEINKIRLFSIPSNAALNRDESLYIYNTYPFPRWKICYGRDSDKNHSPVLYKDERGGCPLCGSDKASATRFVAACPDGHLDEVPWHYLVHSERTGCNSRYFYWKIEGPSIAHIKVECPECGQSSSLRDIYRKKFRCTGRFPENGDGNRGSETCELEMKTIQRQSTSLRIPVTLTLVKIPYKNKLDEILEDPEFRGGLISLIKTGVNKEDLLSYVRENKGEYYHDIEHFITERGYGEFCEYVLNFTENRTADPLADEFQALREMQSSEILSMGRPVDFSVDSQLSLKIIPVRKLKLTTVQIGYFRSPYLKKNENSEVLQPRIVRTGARDALSGTWWYPAFESAGEGLFITADVSTGDLSSPDVLQEWNEKNLIHDEILRKNRSVTPEFVWWHTLSHALIRAVSLYSGYASASIRERVYSDGCHGGILLYSSSIGDECSMGGLSGCASESRFDEIWKMAMKDLEFCSNDPICHQNRISEGNYNGSACHSCLMISETSCEHRNRWLDRHVVLGD